MFIDRDIQLTTSIFILDLVPVTVYEATELSLEFIACCLLHRKQQCGLENVKSNNKFSSVHPFIGDFHTSTMNYYCDYFTYSSCKKDLWNG